MITGLKDLDREILKHLNDVEVAVCFAVSKTIYFKVCDDEFLKRRLSKYPSIFKYKDKRESYKVFYSRAVSRIYIMKRDYNFEYYEGDFYQQLYLFRKYAHNGLLRKSCQTGEFSLVKYCIGQGYDVNLSNNYAIRVAADNGHLEIVKYLIEKGADAHANDDEILRASCRNGHLEIVRYAVEILKFDIHIHDESPIKRASAAGHLEIVKYLVDRGALIHVDNFECMKYAKENKHHNVVDYLEYIRRKNLKIF